MAVGFSSIKFLQCKITKDAVHHLKIVTLKGALQLFKQFLLFWFQIVASDIIAVCNLYSSAISATNCFNRISERQLFDIVLIVRTETPNSNARLSILSCLL